MLLFWRLRRQDNSITSSFSPFRGDYPPLNQEGRGESRLCTESKKSRLSVLPSHLVSHCEKAIPNSARPRGRRIRLKAA